MTEQAKDVLFSEHLKYMGKVLKKEGVRTDKEGKEIHWKLWKLNFESGKQYEWSCSLFGNYDAEGKPLECKGKHISDMYEGAFYEVVYKNEEYQHAEYGTVKSKKAVLIKESTEENSTMASLGQAKDQGTNPPKEVAEAIKEIQKVSAEGIVEFTKEYLGAMEKAGKEPNSMHMLGAYIVAKHNEQFEDIITIFKKSFETKKLLEV